MQIAKKRSYQGGNRTLLAKEIKNLHFSTLNAAFSIQHQEKKGVPSPGNISALF
jgi:hypothetical protein